MRHGQGVCLYADGSIYEGSWLFGREQGQGSLMTAERQVSKISYYTMSCCVASYL